MSIGPSPQNVTARYDRLRRSLAAIGFVCMGSMVRRYMPCGKPGCRCAEGTDHWHGPYYQWTRKIKGRTVTIRLTPEQAQLLSGYVRNDRQLRRVVAQMRAISLAVVQAELARLARRKRRPAEIRG